MRNLYVYLCIYKHKYIHTCKCVKCMYFYEMGVTFPGLVSVGPGNTKWTVEGKQRITLNLNLCS